MCLGDPYSGEGAMTGLAATSRSAKRARVTWAFLNSKFFLTVIGSLAVALITQAWQHRVGENERRAAREAAVRDAMRDTMIRFVSGFRSSLEYGRNLRKREIYLRENHSSETPPRYRDKRTFEDTRSYFEDQYERYLKSGTFDGLCGMVRAGFSSAQVRDSAKVLDGIMDEFMRCPDEAGLQTLYNKGDKQFEALIEVMIAELDNVNAASR